MEVEIEAHTGGDSIVENDNISIEIIEGDQNLSTYPTIPFGTICIRMVLRRNSNMDTT